MSVAVRTYNVAPNPNDVTGAGLPTGAITMWAAATAPSGWLLCDGTAVSRVTYANLFSIIGTTWGSGNGTTTFNVPNTAGRTVRGVGTASWTGLNSGTAGTTVVTLAGTGGADGTKQVIANIPPHNHVGNGNNFVALGSGSFAIGTGANTTSSVPASYGIYEYSTGNLITDPATGGTNTNTLTTNAYVGINHIIKA